MNKNKKKTSLDNDELLRLSRNETKSRAIKRIVLFFAAIAASICVEIVLFCAPLAPAIKIITMVTAIVVFSVFVRKTYNNAIEAFAGHIFNDSMKQ